MESTILQAVASVFVESSEIGWVLPALIGFGASIVGALIGAWSTRKAAKEGTKTAIKVADKGAKAAMKAAERGAEAAINAAEVGANASIKAAKEGAEKAYQYSLDLEEEKVQRDGKALLTLLYMQYSQLKKVLKIAVNTANSALEHVKNIIESKINQKMPTNDVIGEYIGAKYTMGSNIPIFNDIADRMLINMVKISFQISSEYISKITLYSNKIGFSCLLCAQILESYKFLVGHMERLYGTDPNNNCENWIIFWIQVQCNYENFVSEFQKIEKYYKEHVKPELNITQ